MSGKNEQTSKKVGVPQSKFSKSRVSAKRAPQFPEGKITKKTGNKKNS